MSKLSELPNIGKVVEEKLIDAGINGPETLKSIGSKQAFIRIRAKDPAACCSMLCGLEGAVRGVRWHGLPDDTKADLKAFFKSL